MQSRLLTDETVSKITFWGICEIYKSLKITILPAFMFFLYTIPVIFAKADYFLDISGITAVLIYARFKPNFLEIWLE